MMRYQPLSTEFLSQFKVFLVDASGVLYTDTVLPGASQAYGFLQTLGPVFLATNNSYESPVNIQKNLNTYGMPIELDHILSSGDGLSQDESLYRFLKDKNVYVFGSENAKWYARHLSCVSHYSEADCIVLAATTGSPKEEDQLCDFVKKNTDIPLVCVNPDRVVRTSSGFYPVVGSLAEYLSQFLKNPIVWFGKPMLNYAEMVKKRLAAYTLDRSVCFFDDNPKNVCALQDQLGITGIWVHQTGIGYQKKPNDSEFGKPNHVIERFSLLSF